MHATLRPERSRFAHGRPRSMLARRKTGSRAVSDYRVALRRESPVTALWVGASVAAGAACFLLARPVLAVPGLVHAIEHLPAPLPALLGVTGISTPDRLLDAAFSGLIAPVLALTYAIGVGSRA